MGLTQFGAQARALRSLFVLRLVHTAQRIEDGAVVAIEQRQRHRQAQYGAIAGVRSFALGADDHVLVLTGHHIVSDGWSMGVLYGELSALYAAYR